jgi:hypothetical protein
MAEFHDLLGGFSETTNEVSVGGGKGGLPRGFATGAWLCLFACYEAFAEEKTSRLRSI